MRRGAGAAAAAAVLVGMALLALGCGGNGKSVNLRVGVLAPLTGQRDALGSSAEAATKLAQKQIEAAIAKTGSADTVKVVREDEGPDPGTSAEAAKRLRKKKVDCVVGPYATIDAVSSSNQVFVPADVPIISPAASGDSMSGIKDGDLMNRTVLPDRDQAPSLAWLMDRELKGGAKHNTVAIGAYKSPYGDNMTKAFTRSWRKLGGRVVSTVRWPDKTDYAGEVHKLTAKRPDAYVFFDNLSTFGRVVGQLIPIKAWSGKKSWSTDALADPNLTVNPVMLGLRGVAPGAPTDTPAAKAFDRLYKKNTKVERQTFDAQAFDAYILCYLGSVAAGSSKGGKIADKLRMVSGPPGRKYTWQQLPEAVRALRNGEDIDYDGVSGPIDLDARGDPTTGTYDAYKIAKEKIAITGQVPYPPERSK